MKWHYNLLQTDEKPTRKQLRCSTFLKPSEPLDSWLSSSLGLTKNHFFRTEFDFVFKEDPIPEPYPDLNLLFHMPLGERITYYLNKRNTGLSQMELKILIRYMEMHKAAFGLFAVDFELAPVINDFEKFNYAGIKEPIAKIEQLINYCVGLLWADVD